MKTTLFVMVCHANDGHWCGGIDGLTSLDRPDKRAGLHDDVRPLAGPLVPPLVRRGLYNPPIVPDDSYPSIPTLDSPLTRGPWAALLWGAFLGCSWTWVIGMVLPALLLRDYGLWGWVVFAVPNVLGAAAMGWVLVRPGVSARIVREHGSACHQFTVVTVAYHLFVVAWLFSRLFGLGAVPMVVVGIGLCAVIGLRNRRSAMLFVAAGVWLLSIGCFFWAVRAPGAWSLAEWALPSTINSRLTDLDLLLFAPCAFVGFALCPYLDLTFHRARYSTSPGTGVGAFVFGFCVVFFLMIVFSVCYGAQLLPFIEGDAEAELPGLWLVLLAVHLSLQAGFTITVHVRESIENARASTPWLMGAGGLAIVLGLCARLDGLQTSPLTGGLTWGEAGYRGFLLFYGTVFPAYVWLVMIPRLRGPVTTKGRVHRLTIFSAASFATYGLGWIAFVQGRSMAIPLIMVLFVVARVAVELLPRHPEAA